MCGISLSGGGDINGDGFDNILIEAQNARPNDIGGAGENYIVFGNSMGFSVAIILADLDGADNFRLDGISRYDRIGKAVSAAGDINGYFIYDPVILARNVDQSRGEIYVVFAKTDALDASMSLVCLDGAKGFKLEDVLQGDLAGRTVSDAGDINGDGFDDIIIGAPEIEKRRGRLYWRCLCILRKS